MIIQMGRDHGIPSYTFWREQCGLTKPTKWEDLRNLSNNTNMVERMLEIYA